MSGTGYAVTSIDRNSVYTAAIQNMAVTTPNIAAGASVDSMINFTLHAHDCGYLVLNVPGAKVGFAASCNGTGHKIVGTSVRVRVTTLS